MSSFVLANLKKKQLHILITRPEQEATPTAARLTSLGHQVTSVPLFRVIFNDLSDINWHNVSAVILTSANGARALSKWLQQKQRCTQGLALKNIACFAIGDHTAEQARQLGFKTVDAGEADAEALLKKVQDKTDPTKDQLLHIRGAEIAIDLARPLDKAGYVFSDQIAYHMQPRAEAAGELHHILSTANPPIDVVTFFSAKTAEKFATHIKAQKREAHLQNITALCLSKKIATKLHSLPFKDIAISPQPNIDALIEALPE